MEFNNLSKMVKWERQKAMYLLTVAEELGMDIEGYGELAVNTNSGYTYLWLEDYNFTLYMPINCDLSKNDVWILWTNTQDGEEREIQLEYKSLGDIEEWVEEQERSVNEE